MAVISIDLHFEKDRQQAKKARIRREGKIKACGTNVSDRSLFRCLHIGLSTTVTVLRFHDEARQQRVNLTSAFAFPQCHHGSFENSSFAVMFGAWLAPTMIHAFIHASAVRAAGNIGGCWRRRRSSARFLAPAHLRDHLLRRHLSVRGLSPICGRCAARVRPSLAGERPQREAGRRRGRAPAASLSSHATSRYAPSATLPRSTCATSGAAASAAVDPAAG
jgi:hypothetical protein